MKRLLVFIVLFAVMFFTYVKKCIAPTIPIPFYIVASKPLTPYNINDPLLRAFVFYESTYREWIVNPKSGARGLLQYMKVMIDEANKIFRITHPQNQVLSTKPEYTWDDAFDPYKSMEIWYVVQNYKNPDYYVDKSCRIWFGTGKQYDGMTWEDYYNKISNIMLTQK